MAKKYQTAEEWMQKNGSNSGRTAARVSSGYQTADEWMEQKSLSNSDEKKESISNWGNWINRYNKVMKGVTDYNASRGNGYTMDASGGFSGEIVSLIDDFDSIRENANKVGVPNAGRYLSNLRNLQKTISETDQIMAYFGSEDAYNKFVAEQEDYERKRTADLPGLEKEISSLEDSMNKAYLDQNLFDIYSSNDAISAVSADEMRRLQSEISGFSKEHGSIKALDAEISQKKQFLNQARMVQENERLSSVTEDPSFSEFSGYTDLAHYDPVYEYINDRDNARQKIKAEYIQANTGNGMPTDGITPYEEKGYDLMTSDEVAIYNYHYAKGGREEAQDYLNSIQESLNNRLAIRGFADIEDSTALELIFGVSAGLDQFKSGMYGAVQAVTGEEDYLPVSAYQMVSGQVREDLADKGPKILGNSLGQVAYDTVTTSANMLPSILASSYVGVMNPAAGQVVGAALLGSSAAGNAYQEMLNLGYDKNQARGYAALVGASETGLEYLLGGISKLGGKIAGKSVEAILQNVDNALARAAIQLGGSAMSEFSEEYLQDILEPWFQNLTLKTENEIKLFTPDALYSGLLGALTAGVFEGPQTISGEVNTYRTGTELQKAGVSDRLAELGKTFSADTVAYKLAGKVDSNTGAYTIGRLFNEIGATLTEQNKADIAQSLESKGVEPEIAQKHAEIMEYIVEGGTLSDTQMKMIEKNDVLASTMREIIDQNSTVYQRINGYKETLTQMEAGKRENASRTKQAAPGQENTASENTTPSQKTTEAEASQKVSENGKTTQITSGEEVKIDRIESLENGKMTFRLKDGRTVDSSDILYANEGDALVYETVAGMDVGADTANLLFGAYKTSRDVSAAAYARGIQEAFQYGLWNAPKQDMTRGPFSRFLTEHQQNVAYENGRIVARQRANQEAKKGGRKEPGNVHFDGDRSKLNERQRTSISALETVAQVLGVQIYLFESEVQDGKRIGKNGWYNPEDGSIHIDLYAGTSGQDTILFTAAHELTHFIRQWSEKKFRVLSDFLMEEYGRKGVSVQYLVEEQINKAKKNGRTINLDTAFEEVVADSMETMLADGKATKNLAKLKQQDKPLWEKMKSYFHDLAEKIRKAYAGLKPDSLEGKFVADMKDSAEKLQELFVEGLADAGENYQAANEPQSLSSDSGEILYSERDFSEQVDEVLSGTFDRTNALYMGDTPQILSSVGLNGDLPMLTTANHIKNATLPQNDKLHHHGLSVDQVKQLPEKLADPAMIMDTFDSSRNSIVIVTDMVNADGVPLIAVVKADGKGMYNNVEIDANFVTSYYGKNGFTNFVRKNVEADNILYVNKKKATVLSTESGTQWLEQLKNYDFDTIIRKARVKVKENGAAETLKFSDRDIESEFADAGIKFSERVTDKQTLSFLDSQETITTYKTMQIVDGRLYPPMAARIEGKHEDYSELGVWEQATEHPELIKGNGKFKLDKGKGQGSIEAAYNPYMHSSNLVLNDQFSGAYNRTNLVTVECVVPVSEVTSGYHAQYAKDSVGWHPWHTGTVAGSIRKAKGIERQVFLSRWIKPVRIVTDAEVASMYKDLLSGTDIAVPDNVVTPSLLQELKKAGVKIEESGRVKYSYRDSAGNELTQAQQEYFKDSKVRDGLGRLMVMYHQTGNEFTVFDTKRSGAGSSDSQTPYGIFLKKTPGDIGLQGKKQMPLYANITNPLQAANREDLQRNLSDLSSEYKKTADALARLDSDYDKKYEDAKNALRQFMTQWRSEHPDASRTALYNEPEFDRLYNAEDQVVEEWEQKSKELSEKAKAIVTDALSNAGYDGIFLYEDTGSFGRKTDAYIALDSSQVKNVDNLNPTSDPDIRFSDRDPSVQRMNQALEKENAKLKEDVTELKKLLKLQKSLTHGTMFTKSSVESMAKALMENAGANGAKSELAELLNEVYTYIAKNENLTWEGVVEKAKPAVDWILEHVEVKQQADPFGAEVLRELRGSRIYLDEQQRQEAANLYGSFNAFRKSLFGTVTITDKNSVSLDSKWSELSERYPGVFDPNTNSNDMPGALMDAIESLRDMGMVENWYDKTASAQDLLAQVYDGYWRVSTLQTVADVKQKQIDLLKGEHLARMEKVKSDHKAEIAKLKQEHRAELKQVRQEYRESAEAKQRKIVQKYQESRAKGVESRNKTAMRHKVQNVVKELNDYLLKGTKDKHVPIELQKAVAEALDAVNMDTVGAEERIAKLKEDLLKAKTPEKIKEISRKIDHVQSMGDSMKSKLQALKDGYEEIIHSDDPMVANAYDPGIAAQMMTLMVEVGDTPLRDMSLRQLEAVHDVYTMVLTTIRNANKTFKAARNATVRELGQKVMDEVKNVGGKRQYSTAGMEAIRKFGWNNLKPVYAFEMIGSGTFSEIFKNVRSGEDVWAVDVNEARDFYLETAKKYGYNTWDNGKQYEFISTSGMNFRLNLEQIMSLYAYSKREQAAEHLRKGGIVIDETTEVTMKTKLGVKVKFNPTEATAYNISGETLMEIIGKLTPEQKSFVDEMQTYLSSTMGEKGNEISLQLYGIKLFKEKNYFPLKSASQYMAKAKEQQQGEVKIKNSGFSKETVKHASNPVVLTPFMQVWADHVNDMSMYHAFVLPMEDFYRVYNYKTPTSDLSATESVEMSIQNAYGKGATKYIDQLLKDLNGGARVDSTTGVINKSMNLYKKGAVFASASVVIQQPSAIARALSMIDMKYFAGPKVDKKGHKVLWEELKHYAPVAAIKEMGYFDTNMGKSTQDYILGQEYEGIGEKAKALFKDSGYRDEALSRGAALADEVTWCSIWEAVKRETKAKNPGMDVKSEEFLKLAGERFTDVIVKTQVYDSVLSRSANMRSKDTGMKMATAFMAEPTTSINMVVDALVKGKRNGVEGRRYCRRAIGSVVAAQILNSILVSFVYAARDDDEDETYLEKYAGAFVAEVIDGLNPATYIPFIKDIVSIVQGYDVERSDMAVVSDLWNAWEQLDSDNLSGWRKVEGFAGSICQIFGLPLKNIMRDIRGMYQAIDTFTRGQETTLAGLKYAAIGAVTGEDVSDREQLYQAYLDGDKEHLARVRSRYDGEDSYNAAMRTAIKEHFLAEDIDETLAAKYLVKYGGQDGSEAHWTVDEWKYAKENGTSNGYGMYNKFYTAVRTGEDLKTVIQEYTDNGVSEYTLSRQITTYFKPMYVRLSTVERSNIKGYLVNALEFCGVERDAAMERIGDWDFEAQYGFAYEDRKQAYMDGQVSAADLRKILVKEGGFTAEDAAAQVEVYDWNKLGYDATVSNVKKYNTYCKPAGVPKDAYLQIVDYSNNTKNDVDEDGNTIHYSAVKKIMKRIDQLSITDNQKTAIALSLWKESTVEKYKLW